MKSILQDKKECFVTGNTEGLHKHHIFFGTANREISDQHGLWVWLSWYLHVADSPYKTPHNDNQTDRALRKICQAEYEKTHTRDEFMDLIGRNYL